MSRGGGRGFPALSQVEGSLDGHVVWRSRLSCPERSRREPRRTRHLEVEASASTDTSTLKRRPPSRTLPGPHVDAEASTSIGPESRVDPSPESQVPNERQRMIRYPVSGTVATHASDVRRRAVHEPHPHFAVHHVPPEEVCLGVAVVVAGRGDLVVRRRARRHLRFRGRALRRSSSRSTRRPFVAWCHTRSAFRSPVTSATAWI